MKKIPATVYTATFVLLLFTACKTSPDANSSETSYLHQGDSIVQYTFDTLRKALTASIATKGLQEAVHYCNEQAYPITSILASENISIKRVAEKTRNPQNALDSLDKVQWSRYKAAKEKGDSLKAAVIITGPRAHYYKPILLQPMCLTCHGKAGQDIPASLVLTIDSLYPSDQAKGFQPGDLRGMWHIVFNKEGK